AHHRRAHTRQEAGARERSESAGRDDAPAQGRDQSQPRADARGRAGVHSLRAVRQHRPRLQLGRGHQASLTLCDVVLTEAGFGADLGAEKFFDIKCRMAGLNPEAAILVATVRALKMHGGVKKDALGKADVEAVKRGAANVRRHIKNVKKFGVPVVVALNRFLTDSEAELAAVRAEGAAEGGGVVLGEVWGRGGGGGVAVAGGVLKLLEARSARFKPLYDEKRPIREKIETIAQEIYRAGGVAFAPTAERA